MSVKEIFAERVKVARRGKGLSQDALAKTIGATKPYISGIELGRRTTTIEKLVELADVLEVSIDYLCGRTDKPEINR